MNSMSVMPPGSCLMSNELRGAARKLGQHAAAHVEHVLAQLVAAHVPGQHAAADVLESLADARAAGDAATAEQGLVLPGPGAFLLVALERREAR